jgi:hypothetical protein
MGYIRSNSDYYISCGRSSKEASIQDAIDKRGLDHGFCNPIKAKIADEEEKEIREEFRDKESE